MKTLDRNDERIVKAIVAKYEKLKARIDNTSERIAKIEEEYRLKAEAKKRELVLDITALDDEQAKLELAIESMYGMKMDEAISAIADDTTEVVDEPAGEVESDEPVSDTSEETVVDEDEIPNIEEEADKPADLIAEQESKESFNEFDDTMDNSDGIEENDDEDDDEYGDGDNDDDGFGSIDDFLPDNPDGTLNFLFN